MAARHGEERVRRHVAEADRSDRGKPAPRDPDRLAHAEGEQHEQGERADARADERRERGSFTAAEAEEVGEEPEHDGGDSCERDGAGAVGRLRTPLLGGREHGAREREHQGPRSPRQLGRSPVAIEIAKGTIAPQATIGETIDIVPSDSAL